MSSYQRRAVAVAALTVAVLALFLLLAVWGPDPVPCEEPGPYDTICST